MANRWGAPEGPYSTEDDDAPRGEGALPPAAVDSWRTWLLTGKSGVVTDRRRVRGSHRGLKQMLVDGTGTDLPQTWKHFSGAMVRLAINDGLNTLPTDQTHVVWLAYFGGLSNSQIAQRLGMSLGGVERRLKLAFEQLSDYVEHGRTAGRRAIYAIAGWLSLRRLIESHPTLVQAVAAAGATAAVVVGAAGSTPASASHATAATPAAGAPRAAASPLPSPPVASASAATVATTAAAANAVTSTVAATQGSVKTVVGSVKNVVPPLPSPPPLPTPPPVP
ncbi:MAG TPA: sigma-70 family RNA polymerase sigma factor [Candidatus Dormibacteraeota bacterium]